MEEEDAGRWKITEDKSITKGEGDRIQEEMRRTYEERRALRALGEFSNELLAYSNDEIPKWMGYNKDGAISFFDR